MLAICLPYAYHMPDSCHHDSSNEPADSKQHGEMHWYKAGQSPEAKCAVSQHCVSGTSKILTVHLTPVMEWHIFDWIQSGNIISKHLVVQAVSHTLAMSSFDPPTPLDQQQSFVKLLCTEIMHWDMRLVSSYGFSPTYVNHMSAYEISYNSTPNVK